MGTHKSLIIICFHLESINFYEKNDLPKDILVTDDLVGDLRFLRVKLHLTLCSHSTTTVSATK
jgi:hypothetical protein